MTIIVIILISVVLYWFFKGDSSNTSSQTPKTISPRLNEVEHLSPNFAHLGSLFSVN
jgi:hypothetical protein